MTGADILVSVPEGVSSFKKKSGGGGATDKNNMAPAKERNKEVNISSLAFTYPKRTRMDSNKGRKVKKEKAGMLHSNSGNGSQAGVGPCPI